MVRLREWRFDHARPLFTGASRRDSANSEDFLPVRFLSYGEAVTFSHRKRLAPDVPTGTTKSRLATAKPFLEISKWRAESIRVARNPSFWVDFGSRESGFFFPFKRAIRETGDR